MVVVAVIRHRRPIEPLMFSYRSQPSCDVGTVVQSSIKPMAPVSWCARSHIRRRTTRAASQSSPSPSAPCHSQAIQCSVGRRACWYIQPWTLFDFRDTISRFLSSPVISGTRPFTIGPEGLHFHHTQRRTSWMWPDRTSRVNSRYRMLDEAIDCVYWRSIHIKPTTSMKRRPLSADYPQIHLTNALTGKHVGGEYLSRWRVCC